MYTFSFHIVIANDINKIFFRFIFTGNLSMVVQLICNCRLLCFQLSLSWEYILIFSWNRNNGLVLLKYHHHEYYASTQKLLMVEFSVSQTLPTKDCFQDLEIFVMSRMLLNHLNKYLRGASGEHDLKMIE